MTRNVRDKGRTEVETHIPAKTPAEIRAAYDARETFARLHAPLGLLTEAEIAVILKRTAKALGVHPMVVLGAVNG